MRGSALVASLTLAAFATAIAGCSGHGAARGSDRSPTRGRTVRVGTTGDYAPFSVRHSSGDFAGVDIDLARDFGQARGYRIEFVGTTWPTLMDDLLDERFQLAMSGISDTDERRAVARFSQPYYVGGKQAVVRCADRDRLPTLERLDTEGHVVFANPGGTNEAFVRRIIRRAEIRRVDDNLAIFERLAAGEGDVMFTDAIEAAFQTRHRIALCIGLSNAEWEPSPIAILLPRDSAIASEVDRWLGERLSDGTVERIFRTHLESADGP
ncbi:MAG: transporter substrate-binding domain-containing protein [Myxococcota bacterium]